MNFLDIHYNHKMGEDKNLHIEFLCHDNIGGHVRVY